MIKGIKKHYSMRMARIIKLECCSIKSIYTNERRVVNKERALTVVIIERNVEKSPGPWLMPMNASSLRDVFVSFNKLSRWGISILLARRLSSTIVR